MDYKKIKAPTTTVTQNLMDFAEPTGNIYESVAIMGRRANQITADIKQDLGQKLKEFGSKNDVLDEDFYERMAKPTLIAEQEFLDGKIYYRNPTTEKNKMK